jgi:hypothetical protein
MGGSTVFGAVALGAALAVKSWGAAGGMGEERMPAGPASDPAASGSGNPHSKASASPKAPPRCAFLTLYKSAQSASASARRKAYRKGY